MNTNSAFLKLIVCFFTAIFFACGGETISEEKEAPKDPPKEVQKISINSDDYKHQFKGGGVSIGLFLGHHYSMNTSAQDKAIRLLSEDCNMSYFQDYIEIYPTDNPEYFDRRANYVKAAKVYQPDLEFSLVGNKFPKDLMTDLVVGTDSLKVLNTSDPKIYDKLANWWFQLFKGFKERGVSTKILNVVNEPDLDRLFRKHHYGLNGDTKEAVSLIFKHAVPKFKQMFNDASINTLNMETPLIMGPSTISPVGCIDYINYFKSKHPDVWNGIDIVATHQYENGGKPDLFKNIVAISDGKPIYQSETHALKGDGLNLNNVFATRDLKATLSLSNLFSTAVNNGVSSWFYFENNYPNVEVHPGGLLSIPWNATTPIPYKHYYAYRELTSAQPANSHVIGYEMSNSSNTEIIVFRKKDENYIYAHFSNYNAKSKDISIEVKEGSSLLNLKGYQLISTDALHNGEEIDSKTFSNSEQQITLTVQPLSVNTIKIKL